VGRRGDQELAKLQQTVQEHIAAGHQQFVVSVYCMADGIAARKIYAMQEAGQQVLLDMGLNVTELLMTSGNILLITRYKSRNNVSQRRSVRSARRRSRLQPSCVAIVAPI
jgi:hypothetical protein